MDPGDTWGDIPPTGPQHNITTNPEDLAQQTVTAVQEATAEKAPPNKSTRQEQDES